MFTKNILLFGAGKSATVLIDYLLNEAANNNWKITIADANQNLLDQKIRNHSNGEGVVIDIQNDLTRSSIIEKSDLVISMMPPSLHILIAKDCIRYKKSLLTASYVDDAIKSLSKEVDNADILFLCELGLDPGIDHMSAMQLLDEIHESGGQVHSFKSHCGGLVAPASDNNPWKYKISWNPRNVVMAGKAGAIYKKSGTIVEESYETLFDPSRIVSIHQDNIINLSYYPNRNSLPYIDLYNLNSTDTFIRTTLRYPDFMYGWNNIIELGLTDESPIYDTNGKTLQDFFRDFLSTRSFDTWLDQKLSVRFAIANALLESLLDEQGKIKTTELTKDDLEASAVMAEKMHEANITLKQLLFLGLDDNQTIINKGLCSAAEVLQFALEEKLKLEPTDKDMIVMLHEIEYTINQTHKSIQSSLVVIGDDSMRTAMAKTVGLPLGITAKLILNGTIQLKGVHIPIMKEVYEPVLNELKHYGVVFQEKRL